MLVPRVIPVLQVLDGWLVKTRGFESPQYLGDAINAVKIFNEMKVDELVVCDIGASRRRGGPDLQLIEDIVSEAFMPVAYGGGIRSVQGASSIVGCGVEKVLLNTGLVEVDGLLQQLSNELGSQSVVASVDFRRSQTGVERACIASGREILDKSPVEVALAAVSAGAGEIVLNSVDRERSRSGYDLDLIAEVSRLVDVPIVSLGGAGSVDDFRRALDAGASAVAAGSMFSFFGRHDAVLITYPETGALLGLRRD